MLIEGAQHELLGGAYHTSGNADITDRNKQRWALLHVWHPLPRIFSALQLPGHNAWTSLRLLVAALHLCESLLTLRASCSHGRATVVLLCQNVTRRRHNVMSYCCCAAGPPSSVQLSTPYLDERVRLGKGSRGSLFVFTRGGAADQAGMQKRLATRCLITQVSSQGQTCRMATQLPNTDSKFSVLVLQLKVVHLVPPPTWYRMILVSASSALGGV
jgi:hypothetical protein